MSRKLAPVRPLRDARADAAGGPRERGGALGPRAPLRDDLSRCRSRAPATPTATRSSTRSSIAVRRDLHASTTTATTSSSSCIPTSGSLSSCPRCSPSSRALDAGPVSRTTERLPDRAVGRRAPLLHRQRHLPRPGLAQARSRRGPAGERGGRRADRPGRRRARAGHHRARQRRGDGRGQRRDAGRVTPRCRTASASTTPPRTARRSCPASRPNSLTSSDWRDQFAGTPWHKHVPARIEPVGA